MQLQYGMPCMEAKFYSQQFSFLDRLFTEFTNEFKLPGDEEVAEQLKHAVEHTKHLSSDIELKRRYRLYDQSLENYVAGMGSSLTAKEIFTDICPLIYKLKLHYKQARPFQHATSLGVEMFPAASLTANCPSFPSMHSTAVCVIYNTLAGQSEQATVKYRELAEDVMQSRMRMGVCLAADVEAGRLLAEKITSDSEFKIKYRL